MKPQRVSTPWMMQPGSSQVVHEPLGVALIIGAWNYPLQLTLAPLVACIAAGNCALLKPSELAPHCSAALAEYLPKYLDPECIAVVQGGVSETTALLAQRFDKIFYTGGANVGRIIMTAAAKYLTPVTLELGGKSPCIVDKDIDLDVAARRIAFGKFLNAGQTCVAPDYILVHRKQEEALLEALSNTIETFYEGNPKDSEDFGRIIDERHHDRLTALLKGNTVVTGGEYDKSRLYIAPTVLRDVSPDAAVMQEEIFGPILPVLAVEGIDEAIDFVNAREKPLALYLFSENDEMVARVTNETSAGGMCVNETVFHLIVPNLPFGGVGESGMGKYHGKWGFDLFSNAKAILNHGTGVDPHLRYPPYRKCDQTMLRLGITGTKETIKSKFK
jgi:aldehyde dehydrogenase (NAD+)